MCSQEVLGYPTTLNIVDFSKKRPIQLSYQLRTQRPRLMLMEDGHIRWLEVGPEAAQALGDRLKLIEFDVVTGQTRLLDEIHLPFRASLNVLKRGSGCWLAQATKGPPSERKMVYVSTNASSFIRMVASTDERPLFWDPIGSGFVSFGPSGLRTIDCELRTVPTSSLVKSTLSVRPYVDRYYSLPDMSTVAVDYSRAKEGGKALLQTTRRQGEFGDDRIVMKFDSIHGLAERGEDKLMAIVTDKDVQIFREGVKVRSVDISTVSGCNTQIEFLKGRPALVLLDDANVSITEVGD
ncbi:hypothetical protein J5837_08930 [Pseudoxanthomonas helianthi]|uniref:Uncharacterized protein n=1 Tax=Pseudoxanthomonas helianthi TaxID=1453541 RepID=A0A940X3J2_9GAMM|nr:hypothetical protein [Pseudoxanthomonas helianthi]MBP3984552.1 hypothetical protein [Pseudoxanthomonas helianthi]